MQTVDSHAGKQPANEEKEGRWTRGETNFGTRKAERLENAECRGDGGKRSGEAHPLGLIHFDSL
jgi:hypothetical protein